MKRILIFLMLTSIAGFISSCQEKFDDAKYRCKINGKNFIPSDGLIDFSYTEQQGNDRIRIRGTALATNIISGNRYGELEIQFSFDETNPGTIQFPYDAVYYGNNEWDKTFRSWSSDPGSVTITSLDLDAKRVTADFELTLHSDDSLTTLVVSDGFFDQSW